jgi:hypothetical protein
MNSIQISDPGNLFEVLQGVSGWFSKDYERTPLFFNDSSDLEDNKALGSNISLFGINYDMSIWLSSYNFLEFFQFKDLFNDSLKSKKISYICYPLNNNRINLKKSGENFFLYGIERHYVKKLNILRIFCGSEGLIPKSLSKKRDFIESVNELEFLANLLFYPFIGGEREGNIHYLTLTQN